MKKLGLLFATVIMIMIFTISANAATEGYYSYEIVNDEATITDVNTEISGDITVPETLGDYPVTSIGIAAFKDCTKLQNLTINDNIKSIDSAAFGNCSGLQSITLSDSVKSIGNGAFENCLNLKSITLPFGIHSIGNFMFLGCEGLTNITIPSSVKSIGYQAFAGCYNLSDITIPDSVTYIDNHAFESCKKLKNITIPNSVKHIGSAAFIGCSGLTEITIPASVEEIYQEAFAYCDNLENIYVDENNAYFSSEKGVLFTKEKTALEQYPKGNDRTSYIVPNSVTQISKRAFNDCKNLTSIVIPSSVTDISMTAFTSCNNLEDVYFIGTEEQWKSISIGEANECLLNANIHYHAFHSYTSTITKEATHFKEGEKFFICECGDFYFEIISKIEDHIYRKVVIDPTCTENGCTTYSCECGYSYTEEKIMLGHDLEGFVVTKDATCTVNGEERADCSRCDYYETRELIANNHKDENLDGYCEYCQEFLADKDCYCVCHAKTIGAFVYKLFKIIDSIFNVNLAEKVFGITDICVCGIKH